jgi:hypothetical protein
MVALSIAIGVWIYHAAFEHLKSKYNRLFGIRLLVPHAVRTHIVVYTQLVLSAASQYDP